MEALTNINPVSYGVDPMRQVALQGSVPEIFLHAMRLHPIAVDVAVMFAFGMIFLVPAIWLFSKQD